MQRIKVQTLKKANQAQIESMALIHHQVLKESFLCKFGYKFLFNLYRSICSDKQNVIQVVTLGNKVIGYSVATGNVSKFYKTALYKNFFGILLEILRNSPGNLRLLLNILIWALTPRNGNQSAELQFLAILPKYQRLGLGTKLLYLLKNEYLKHDIASFRVGTKADNLQSNNFYKKRGFKYLYQKEIVGEKFNYYLSS